MGMKSIREKSNECKKDASVMNIENSCSVCERLIVSTYAA